MRDLLATIDGFRRRAGLNAKAQRQSARHPARERQQAIAGSAAMNTPLRYKGYVVAPSAPQLPNGMFAANLTIGTQPGAQHSFDALDYFFDERHALAYACRWARMWIDEQRRCA
jgi:hypothetical protein